MALGISSIGPQGLPPAVLAHYERNVQNRTQPTQGAMYPQTGTNAGVQLSARDTFTPQNQMFTRWNQTFYGREGQDPSTFINLAGETAKENTIGGVKAHEDAHRLVAQKYGLSTGDSIVETNQNMAEGGHVTLQIPEFDSKQAFLDPSYLKDFRYKSEGVVASAEAPQHVISQYGTTAGLDSKGYGELSQADKDIAATGRANLAKVANFKSSDAGKALATLGQNPSPRAQQQLALMAHHPDLLKAFNNGTMG
jgi:hypothetical protein